MANLEKRELTQSELGSIIANSKVIVDACNEKNFAVDFLKKVNKIRGYLEGIGVYEAVKLSKYGNFLYVTLCELGGSAIETNDEAHAAIKNIKMALQDLRDLMNDNNYDMVRLDIVFENVKYAGQTYKTAVGFRTTALHEKNGKWLEQN